MRVKFDNYTLIARIFPAIITSIPILLLYFYLQDYSDFKEPIDFLLSLNFLGNLSISIIFLYLYSQLIRILSKNFEKKYFKKSIGFPTTYLLLFSNSHYTDSFKINFRKKANEKLNVNLYYEKKEKEDIKTAIKLLDETIKQIIVRIGEQKLIKLHNIWYGFIRNLIGGSIFGCLFSVIILFFSIYLKIDNLIVSYVTIFVFYFFIFAFHKKLLIQVAEDYANKLIMEFMAS